ncbi:alanine--tRNA ligase [Quadrisphaera sp. KR29]|uniref:alanine--tRNA ligase n=1 Tax=Quadrisphaera sp. KR29 TaxID=3461391 RepID=UPI00404485A8
METAEIRRRWLDFFEARGHTVVPSASLISPDPALLFTVAGMVPFIPYLTGQQTPPYSRATSVQKCVRTLDIDEVGKTTRHGTFFQMNGNFSFGDYFKEGAITYAWELVTSPQSAGGYGFDPEKIWVTVYEDDDEAHALWRRVAGLPAERIQRRGRKDNYWHTGAPGPGGPCSEIYVDRGPEFGREGGPVVDEDRYLEIWNLVFMQHQLADVRSKEEFTVTGPLPKQNIDTGMGLERVAYLLQGVDNLYEIDQVAPVLHRAADLAGVRYGADHEADVRLRVVADHVRSGLMLMGDGVTPSNEAGGYVLRRIIRRAVRAMRLLGVDAPTLPELLPVSMEAMAPAYPELRDGFGRTSAVAYAEEDAFRRTLAAGTTILDTAVSQAKKSSAASGSAPRLSGERAFELHDTFGFPIDLTLEMAAEQGVDVDADGFRRLMTEQRTRAREDARAKRAGRTDTAGYREVADALGRDVDFLGYEVLSAEGRVVGLLRDGASVPVALAGDDVELVLDRTPFYAESGGQLADRGRLTVTGPTGTRAVVEVSDVQRPIPGLNVHHATVVSGEVAVGDPVEAVVDAGRRLAVARAHTATHLVHQGLRDALGPDGTRQAGSENAPGRLRFDYTALSAPSPAQLSDVEAEVNTFLADDLPVTTTVTDPESARRAGALAFFGDKYGDRVRMVGIGEWSKELCGGTHVERTGQLGVVALLGEQSIGSGTRRVEALVGPDAHAHLARESALVSQLTGLLKVRSEELPDRVSALLDQLREADRTIAAARAKEVLAGAGALAAGAELVGGSAADAVRLVATGAGEVASADDLRTLALDVRGRLGESAAVVAVGGVAKGRPVVVIATSPAARAAGLRAGALVRVAATALGGGGGGKDDVAQGGGTDAQALPAALDAVRSAVAQAVGAA